MMWIFTDKEKGYERKKIFGAFSIGSGTDKMIIIIIIIITIIIIIYMYNNYIVFKMH